MSRDAIIEFSAKKNAYPQNYRKFLEPDFVDCLLNAYSGGFPDIKIFKVECNANSERGVPKNSDH